MLMNSVDTFMTSSVTESMNHTPTYWNKFLLVNAAGDALVRDPFAH